MIALFTIGFGRPDLIYHQKRLLDKYLIDDFGLCVIDNTPGITRSRMERVCRENNVGYIHNEEGKTSHDDALNFAALHVTQIDVRYFGFLDADVLPRKCTSIIDKLDKAGFYGVSQTHGPTGARYLWPGLCFFSKDWLGDRRLNFSGIRGLSKRDDGDCGSMNHTLFSAKDWERMPLVGCSYGTIRDALTPDENIQSWGYEVIGDWVHLMNSSHWLDVPNPGDRDRLLLQMVECL